MWWWWLHIRYIHLTNSTLILLFLLMFFFLVPQLFRSSILDNGGSVINEGYPVQFLPLGIVGVTVTSFSSTHVLITGPALCKKISPKRFEMNLIMLRPNSDTFRGIFRLCRIKMKADTKVTVAMCCQVFNRKSLAQSSGDFWRQFLAAIGAAVVLKTS